MSVGGTCVSTGLYSDGKPTCYCQRISPYGAMGQGVIGTRAGFGQGYGAGIMPGMRRGRLGGVRRNIFG